MNEFVDFQVNDPEECLTVFEATQRIKLLLETGLPPMQVEGEISNFLHHNSGHMYFSIKDAKSQMPCVMWAGRNASLRFKPLDGLKVRVDGRITVYERRGAYQFDVVSMQPAGIGPLQELFEQLKNQLNQEGLFDEIHKQPLPAIPSCIGIVTSETGAAIRDIVSVIRRRWPVADIILRPTMVQGTSAAPDIVAAIEDFNEFGSADVLIVGRGGGSLEDLWAFNEEVVARAIFQSQIPIVSAVGHQIDFTIADFVADLRAPTPSAAGELVVPDALEYRKELNSLLQRSFRFVESKVHQAKQKLNGLVKSYALRRPFDEIMQTRQMLDEIQNRLNFSIKNSVVLERQKLTALSRHLESLSYTSTLNRGFSIVRNKKTKEIIDSIAKLSTDQDVEIQHAQGRSEGKITRIIDD